MNKKEHKIWQEIKYDEYLSHGHIFSFEKQLNVCLFNLVRLVRTQKLYKVRLPRRMSLRTRCHEQISAVSSNAMLK